MANIKSQIKRNRTNEIARLRNKSVKSSLKTAVRKVRTAADAGDKATAEVELKAACRSLDKAASKGVIHANQAANRKSALAHLVNAGSDPPPSPAPALIEQVTGASCCHQIDHRLLQRVLGIHGDALDRRVQFGHDRHPARPGRRSTSPAPVPGPCRPSTAACPAADASA